MIGMDESLTKTMHMTVKWITSCAFIFQSWEADGGFLFVFGLIITVIVSFLSIAMPAVKNAVFNRVFRSTRGLECDQNDQNNSKSSVRIVKEDLFTFLYVFIYSLLHISNMMLVMTFNGYVILALIAGMTIGFSCFKIENDSCKELPVNCCA